MMRLLGIIAIVLAISACSSTDGEEDPPSTEKTVTAGDVIEAVQAAELEIPNLRDNTAGNCDPSDDEMLPCTELLTSDVFTVRVWVSSTDAQSWIDASPGDPPLLIGEKTTVDFQDGGTTPPYDRPAYERAMAGLG